MLGIIIILLFAVYLTFFLPYEERATKEPAKSPRYTAQLNKLWQVAQTSMKERKPLRAEKALLTILKFDEKNAAAYNRLGILYAKSQKFDEAIECFEIAQSLDNNPSSLHNVGLIYLETGAYEKAEIAFKQAVELEGDVPARFIALAKTQEKLGARKSAIESLENAYELDPQVSTLRQILALYESAGDSEAIAATTARIEQHITESAKSTATKRRTLARRTATKPKIPATGAKSTVARAKSAGAKPKTTKRKVI